MLVIYWSERIQKLKGGDCFQASSLGSKTELCETLFLFILTYLHLSLLETGSSLRLDSLVSPPYLAPPSPWYGIQNPIIVICWLIGLCLASPG